MKAAKLLNEVKPQTDKIQDREAWAKANGWVKLDEDQNLPESYIPVYMTPYNEGFLIGKRQQAQDMLAAGFKKVVPMRRKYDQSNDCCKDNDNNLDGVNKEVYHVLYPAGNILLIILAKPPPRPDPTAKIAVITISWRRLKPKKEFSI